MHGPNRAHHRSGPHLLHQHDYRALAIILARPPLPLNVYTDNVVLWKAHIRSWIAAQQQLEHTDWMALWRYLVMVHSTIHWVPYWLAMHYQWAENPHAVMNYNQFLTATGDLDDALRRNLPAMFHDPFADRSPLSQLQPP